MLIDIGGGSVELARFEDRAVTGLWSFPLGTLSSGARFLQDDPPTNGQIDRLREAVVEAMEEAGVPRLGRRERLVGTGGAIRNVAKVDRRRRRRVYPVPRLHGYEMRRGRVEKVANLLRSMPASERGGIPGLNPSRAETIVAGATLLETVMATLKTRVMVVSGQGLREGVVRATLGELPPAELAGGLPDPRSVRRASIRAVAGRFTQIDEGAAQRRGWAALELLDRTESTVSAQLRELIGYTATMVDVGTAIDFYNRESVAAQIVMETDLAGFSHLMIAEFASLLQLLEDPRFDVHRFAPLLSADERGGLDLAATALTLAFELHRRIPPHAVGLVATSATEETITIEVPGSIGRLPAPLVERVERTFKRKLQVVRRRED
jgi:exopolyphosphatase/guanosine-5'-triphosphate,3'-diphosphate pyrophosphatase